MNTCACVSIYVFVFIYLYIFLIYVYICMSVLSAPFLNPILSSFVPELNGYLNSSEALEVTLAGVLFHRNGEPDREGGFLICSF